MFPLVAIELKGKEKNRIKLILIESMRGTIKPMRDAIFFFTDLSEIGLKGKKEKEMQESASEEQCIGRVFFTRIHTSQIQI